MQRLPTCVDSGGRWVEDSIEHSQWTLRVYSYTFWFNHSCVSAAFQTLVNDILRGMFNIFVFVYSDNILIFFKSEHISPIGWVLKRLLQQQLFVKADNCEFHWQTVSVLGFVISPGCPVQLVQLINNELIVLDNGNMVDELEDSNMEEEE